MFLFVVKETSFSLIQFFCSRKNPGMRSIAYLFGHSSFTKLCYFLGKGTTCLSKEDLHFPGPPTPPLLSSQTLSCLKNDLLLTRGCAWFEFSLAIEASRMLKIENAIHLPQCCPVMQEWSALYQGLRVIWVLDLLGVERAVLELLLLPLLQLCRPLCVRSTGRSKLSKDGNGHTWFFSFLAHYCII